MSAPRGSGLSSVQRPRVWSDIQIQTIKCALREEARLRRSLLNPEEREKKSLCIVERLLPLLRGYSRVLVYASKPLEVNTSSLIERLLVEGKQVIVPVIVRENRSLRLSYLKDPALLVKSTFDVPEPIGHEIRASPQEVEIAIVPMLAFDSAGNRLGYGAGYYDRFLKMHPHIRKIGLSFACQQMKSIPSNENDVRMDWIVTEEAAIDCRGQRDGS